MKWISRIARRSLSKTQTEEDGHSAAVPSSRSVAGDNPIRSLADDTLGRGVTARFFARQILALDATEGVVVAVLGAWGSGKTSFVNLARKELEQTGVHVLDFNPWMFSGTEQLVESFFVEVAAQLKVRLGLTEVGKSLEDYGEAFSGMAWLPLVGPWLERGRGVAKILGTILQRRKEGVGERRKKLQRALANLGRPIIVVLDDIDRLSTAEIRDVFRLVRLTASFPNVVYLVAFDRARVEAALAEQGVPGRDYLEKILQVAVDLPAIPPHLLDRQIFAALNNVLGGIDNAGSLDKDAWPDIFMEVIRPLVRNMRDVRRYAAAVHGSVVSLERQIELADVLALEAVRVFLPDVFARLNKAIDALTKTKESPLEDNLDSSERKAAIDGLISAAGTREAVVRATINRLFPAAHRHIGGSHYADSWTDKWLKAGRVAHEFFLRFYLERLAGEGLQAFRDAQQVWNRLADRDALEKYIRSIGAEHWQEVISSLETFEDQFEPRHVVPATVALLNLLPDMPDLQKDILGLDARLAITRVTYRLLRSLKEATAIEAAVRQILPEVTSLSAKLELITQVGHREGAGHKLVSEAAANEFERAWRDEVRAMPTTRLTAEKDLVRVLLTVMREADASEAPLTVDQAPELTLAVLRAARVEETSQSLGTRVVRQYPRLAWPALVELYGDEAILRQRITDLNATEPEGAAELLALADRYLSGWRPDRFGRDE